MTKTQPTKIANARQREPGILFPANRTDATAATHSITAVTIASLGSRIRYTAMTTARYNASFDDGASVVTARGDTYGVPRMRRSAPGNQGSVRRDKECARNQAANEVMTLSTVSE